MLETKILCAHHADSLGFPEGVGLSAHVTWALRRGLHSTPAISEETPCCVPSFTKHLVNIHCIAGPSSLTPGLALAPCSNHTGAVFQWRTDVLGRAEFIYIL